MNFRVSQTVRRPLNVYPNCPHLLPDFRAIRRKTPMHMSAEFSEGRNTVHFLWA